MNRKTLANFNQQIDSLKSYSLPRFKQFLQKRISKCINECKIQTINMKKTIGYFSKEQRPYNEGEIEYEFGWGSDFDDLEDDEEDRKSTTDQEDLINNKSLVDLHQNNDNSHVIIKSSYSLKRPISEPPPPPLPKCPPPDLIEETVLNSTAGFRENFYESMSPEKNDQFDSDYLIPNILQSDHIGYNHKNNPSSEVFDRPLPPIPKENDDEVLKSYPWFHDIEREEAENVLRRLGTNGAFLVRHSKRAGICNPYTLTLFFNHRIFHLNIRKRADHLFALGTEKQKEKTFHTVSDLIKYHSQEPIYLTSKGLIAGKTILFLMSTCK